MSAKSKWIAVPLTTEQENLLEPVFDAFLAATEKYGIGKCTLAAQVYRDGLRCKVLTPDETTAVQDALKTPKRRRMKLTASAFK